MDLLCGPLLAHATRPAFSGYPSAERKKRTEQVLRNITLRLAVLRIRTSNITKRWSSVFGYRKEKKRRTEK